MAIKNMYIIVGNKVHGFWTNKKEAVSYFKSRKDVDCVVKVFVEKGKYKSKTVYPLK